MNNIELEKAVNTLIDTAPARKDRIRRALENIGLSTHEAVEDALRSMMRSADGQKPPCLGPEPPEGGDK